MIGKLESGVLFDELIAHNDSGATGWYWRIANLPDQNESRYLYHLLAKHRFQEGLKNYRDLSYLSQNLEEWQENIEVYRNMLDTRMLAYNERLPRTEQSLAEADLDGMVSRKLEMDAHLNTIEQTDNSLGLATAHEFDLWGEITAFERNPALQANIPEAEEVRDKVALLKGVLQWQLDKEFKDRLWKTRRNLRGNRAKHWSKRSVHDGRSTKPCAKNRHCSPGSATVSPA